MRSTTSIPGPRPCPHCGRSLAPRTTELCGREVFCGWEQCPCEGARAEREEWAAERRRAETAQQEAAWERRLGAAGIPPRYRAAEHPWAERLAGRLALGDGFYVWGPNGSGKTHLACAAAVLCLQRGMSVRFETATKLLDELREFGQGQRELLDSLSKCDLLVIDDLGKEGAATPRAAEKLFDLFNDRYNGQTLARPRPVLVTSNFPRGDVASRVSEGGAGWAIASRLAEMTESFPMDGPDRRVSHG